MSEAIHYSRGANKHDNTPAQLEAEDFAQFCDAVLADQAKQKGLQWVAAPCAIAPDDAKHRGTSSMAAAIGRPHRCSECVGPRRWLGFDVDQIPGEEAQHALIAVLQPYSGLAWSTHSHTREAPRLRVLLELDTPGDRTQIIAASQAMRARIDVQLKAAGYSVGWDAACDRPEQPLYLPPVGGESYPLQGAALCLAELVDEAARPAPVAAPIALPPGIVEGDAWAAGALQRAVQQVSSTPPGDRNRVLNCEAYSLGGFVGAGRLNRERVVEAFEAATSGWDNPAKTRGTIRGAIASGMAKPRIDGMPAVQDAVLRLVPLDGFMEEPDEDWPCVVAPILPRRVTTLLGGHGGVGKSMLGLTFAAHVAAGQTWGPLQVERGRAVFLSFEDEAKVVRQRLRRIAEVYSMAPAALLANLAIFDGSDAETELAIEHPDGMGLDFTPMMGLVAEATQGAALVVIDNASDTYGGNENQRRQVRAFIRRLAKIAKANDGALILLAHIDKAAAKGGGKSNSYSGSTQWNNSVRSRLALVESDEAGIELLHEKANYGPRVEPMILQRGERGVLVPVPAAEVAASRAVTEALVAQADADAVLALMHRATDIPTATTGQRTSWHVLSLLPEAPAWLKAKAGKRRLEAALLVLEREGQIAQVERKTANRHTVLRWSVGG